MRSMWPFKKKDVPYPPTESLRDIKFDTDLDPEPYCEEPKIVKEKPVLTQNRLSITYQNGSILTLTLPYTGSVKLPWIKFYTWYFNRESDSFMFNHESGCTMVRRSNITSFEIRIS